MQAKCYQLAFFTPDMPVGAVKVWDNFVGIASYNAVYLDSLNLRNSKKYTPEALQSRCLGVVSYNLVGVQGGTSCHMHTLRVYYIPTA